MQSLPRAQHLLTEEKPPDYNDPILKTPAIHTPSSGTPGDISYALLQGALVSTLLPVSGRLVLARQMLEGPSVLMFTSVKEMLVTPVTWQSTQKRKTGQRLALLRALETRMSTRYQRGILLLADLAAVGRSEAFCLPLLSAVYLLKIAQAMMTITRELEGRRSDW